METSFQKEKNHFFSNLLLFCAIFTLSYLLLFIARPVQAADCGGATACACGDTVIASTTLAADLDCSAGPNNSLIVGANNITINGGGHSLTGPGGTKSIGVSVNTYNGITIINFSNIINFHRGIFFSSSSNGTIQEVTISSSTNGIELNASNSNNLNYNTLNSNTKGVYLDNSDFNTILANTASANFQGIYLANSDNNELTENVISSSTNNGIHLATSANNTLSGNLVSDNLSGFYFADSSLNDISNNTSTANMNGFDLQGSDSNTLSDNYASANENGFYLSESTANELFDNSAAGNVVNLTVQAATSTDWNNTIDTTNTVEDKPVVYLNDVHGLENDLLIYSGDPADVGLDYEYVGDIGMFWCINCSYIEVKDAVLSANNQYGVFFNEVDDSVISNITASDNGTGIYLLNSDSNTITGSTANDNSGYGFQAASSSFNDFSNNTSASNDSSGFFINTSPSNTFYNNTSIQNSSGFYANFSASGEFTNNIASSNSQNGIFVANSDACVLSGNTTRINNKGISIYDSSDNELDSNIIEANVTGIYLDPNTDGANVTSNRLVGNVTDIQDDGSDDIFLTNSSKHSLAEKMITFNEVDRTRALNENISLETTLLDMVGDDCPSCSYAVSVSPDETVAVVQNENTLTSSFIPTRSGIYSLTLTVTDANNNTSTRSFRYLIGSTAEQTTTYYLRGVVPTHGQPAGPDAKSLSLTAPTSQEFWSCAVWIQNSPDQLPSYPLANLSGVDAYSWYKQDSPTTGYVGLERYLTYGSEINASSTVSNTAEYVWVNSGLSNLDWPMEYLNSWYALALKLHGSAPFWITFPEGETDRSYADFTYEYTTSPTIKEISNDNIIILSATASASDQSDASIVIENPINSATSTTLTLEAIQKPFSGATSTIYSDATTTLDISLASGTTVSLSAVNMDIVPPAGSVLVNIDTWLSSDNYYRKWTEESSIHNLAVGHTIGDLAAGQMYSIRVDGVLLGSYIANDSGQISFTYNSGYSNKVFELTKISAGGGGGIISPPGVGSGSYDVPGKLGEPVVINFINPAGVNVLTYVNNDNYFTVLVSRTYLPETHRFKINALDMVTKTLSAFFYSEPQQVILSEGETELVDLDGDGINDIIVQFSQLLVNRVELTIKSILTPVGLSATEVQATTTKAINPLIFLFNRNLKLGLSGSDVKELQKYLNKQGFKVSLKGAGSPGKETAFFGRATQAALIKFQKAKKISPAIGYFGPATRKVVNEK